MLRNLGWKKTLLLIWACALLFGLTYHVAEAGAMASSCNEECNSSCSTGCGTAVSSGGCCHFICSGDDKGQISCMV